MSHEADQLEAAVALAKAAPEAKTKAEWYDELRKHANRIRQPGQRIESAVTAFIKDVDGQAIFEAYNKASHGPSVAGRELTPSQARAFLKAGAESDPGRGDAEGLAKLKQIAAELKARDPKLTDATAMVYALRTPDGMKAAAADRKARIGI